MYDSTPIFRKDPSGEESLGFDWTSKLDGETIASSAWAATLWDGSAVGTGGLSVATSSYTDTTTTVGITAGNLNAVYRLKNTITTSTGRIIPRSWKVIIVYR